MKTLKDILLRAAESNNGLTYIWHRNEKQISYAELLQRAHLNLHHLRKYGISAGAEIILQIEDDLDFIVAFWACILGGFQVLLLPYANKQQAQDTIDSVVDMMKHPYVCISPDESNRTEYSRQHGYPIGTVIDICTADEWDEDIANRVTIHNSKPDDVAVIQFSSGSTGNPKGVCTTHANILPIAASVNLTDKDTTLCWLSLTHNLALLGFHIPATFAACNQIIMSTSYFLTNPLRWFSEVSRRKVTVTTSPNFGYKHFLNFYEKSTQDFDWDLSSLKAIVNGAEPISYDLSKKFLDVLSKYHMKCGVMAPAYGMSECTLAISVAAYGKPLKSITINRDRMNVGDKIEETCDTAAGAAFVSVGEILWCIEIRITDNRGRVLPDSHIGNIEISGSTVMSGYYNDPVMTAEAFAEDHWLKTGDIGVIAKGELFITGRSKEIIFIAGKNYFPNDLEKVIEDKFHSLKNRIAVTSVYNAKTGTEQIVLFMHTGDGDFSQKLITDIRRHFSRITRLQIEYIQFTDEFPRTQNGKLQRYKLKELFIAPDDPISMTSKTQNLSTNDGMEAILTICKEELEINEPDMSDNLFEMGADSLKASVILARLNDALSINLTLNQLYKSQTIEDIAKLAEQERQAAGNAGLHSHCDEMVSIPVSAQQKRMYTLFRIDPGHTNYNITAALQIDDDTDVKKIEKAFAAIVKKNEALRTVFHLEHNQIKQTILDYVEFAVETKTAPGDISEEIKNWIRPYDLAHAPLFRLLLMKQDEDCYVLVIDMHHIITDGTSMGLIVKDFENYYNNQTLSKPSYRYRDYAVWQNSMKEQGRFKTQRDFWHTYLKTRSTVLDLPIDAAERPKYRNKIGDNVIFDIPVTGITNLAKEATASPFNVLFSAYCILLSRYAGQDNVVIGVPVSARTKAQFLDVVGLFVNTVPYNVDIDPHETVRDFIARICSMTIDILVNQDYQLDWIVDELHIKRESNRTPLFDVMFTMENMDIPIRQIPLKEVVCKFDLNLIVTKHADGTMDGNLIYATELYVRSSIENMVKHYITILDAMTANPDVKVGELSAADEVQTANTAIDIPVFEY